MNWLQLAGFNIEHTHHQQAHNITRVMQNCTWTQLRLQDILFMQEADNKKQIHADSINNCTGMEKKVTKFLNFMGLCVKFLVLSLSLCVYVLSLVKICPALCLTRLTPPSCVQVLSLSNSWLPEEIVFLSFRKTTVIKYMVGAWGTQIVDISKKKKKKKIQFYI